MRVVPYRRLELQSPLSVADAAQALASEVEPRQWFRLGAGSCTFEGTVSGSSFELQRIIQYRNSFLPQIRGSIQPAALGCSISITMTLHPLVLVFTSVWLSSVGSIGILFVASALRDHSMIAAALAPLGMLLFATLLTVGGFAFEARKAEALLVAIFAASRHAVVPASRPGSSRI